MKILLIAPASGPWRHLGNHWLFNGKTFRFSLLSLLRLAAETPPDVELQLVDEQFDTVPFDGTADLVGISCMTAAAPRAYELAAHFRSRGIPVVLGGMHPTFCPDEASGHADAIVKGEAEEIWPRLIEDLRAGHLQRVYEAAAPPSLQQLKPVPYQLMSSGRYATRYAVQATRGCPHHCRFCSVSAFSAQQQRRRPIPDVLAEIASIPSRFFLFVDDNLTADLDYAHELFLGLAPLRKLWVTQTTLGLADHPALLRAAAQAGCIGIFAGLETISKANLAAAEKTCHVESNYAQAVERFHAHGIGVEAGIVFGFDRDTPSVFSDTLTFLDRAQIDAIQVSIYTPLPGTPAFGDMQDRIRDWNWAHYDFHHAVFEPRRMSAEALQAGHDWVTREFYRPARIARRVWRHCARPRALRSLPFVLAVNGGYFGRTLRWGIRGWNPAEDLQAPAGHGSRIAPALGTVA